ncbi:hypothetical protein F2Q70_00010376 [Brassica cretica]|uniref:Uncharacterized protein n=1 Tax=Brassica cretica TaxID=69181 RepID=A0A8S9M4X6_BRACR|nr:hypothetical protein F2Q70_00010376 [Brassica cretica]
MGKRKKRILSSLPLSSKFSRYIVALSRAGKASSRVPSPSKSRSQRRRKSKARGTSAGKEPTPEARLKAFVSDSSTHHTDEFPPDPPDTVEHPQGWR